MGAGGNGDWLELVKLTRQKFGCSIEAADDLILADQDMRRLVAWRINHNGECRKQALSDIRRKGEASRFVRDGERLRFR